MAKIKVIIYRLIFHLFRKFLLGCSKYMDEMTIPVTRQRRKKGKWRFLFRSDSVALNFAATVAGSKDRGKGNDRLSEPQLLERWFCEAELPPLAGHVDALDLERAKSLREAIFKLADNRLTGPEIAPSDIALLNSHARAGMPSTRIACDGCSTEPSDAAEVNELLGIISRDAIDVSPAHTGTEFANAPRRAALRCHLRGPLPGGKPAMVRNVPLWRPGQRTRLSPTQEDRALTLSSRRIL